MSIYTKIDQDHYTALRKKQRKERKRKKTLNRQAAKREQRQNKIKTRRRVKGVYLGKGVPCTVYAVREWPGGPIVYIGQTRQPIEKRLEDHYREMYRKVDAKENLYGFHRWLSDHMNQPHIEVIQVDAEWHTAEAVWIDRARKAGHQLLNVASVVEKEFDLTVGL